MSSIFVTDASKRESLAIVRSLAKKGIEVTAGEDSRICCSFFSKYVKNRVIYPNPNKNPLLFIQNIYEIVKKSKYEVIFPVDDPTTILFSKYKDKLSKYTKVPVASYETIMKGRDKMQTIKIATENNIPCPKTYFVEDSNIEKMKSEIEFPIVIKPCESSGARGAQYISSSEELIVIHKRLSSMYSRFLIQEYIPYDNGCAYNVSLLLDEDSKLKAIFTLRKIRSYPVNGGPTTFAESVKEPKVAKYAITLLKAMNWYGVAEVEFLIDKRDGKPKLMEVNPRFWSPLELAIASGVDFPYLLYKMAVEEDVKFVNRYKLGVKYRFLIGDFLWFLSAHNKRKALREFLKFYNEHYAILSLDDPKPIVGFISDNFLSLIRAEGRQYALRR